MPDVRDLRVAAIEATDLRREPGFTHPDWKGALPGLAVTVSTRQDLGSYMPRHAASVVAEASLCDGGAIDDQRRLRTTFELLTDAKVRLPGSSVWIAATPDVAGIYRFTELLWLRSDREDTNAVPGRTERFIAYDLLRDPQDICLRLHGGSMLGGTWSSNTVRITAAELRATLRPTGP